MGEKIREEERIKRESIGRKEQMQEAEKKKLNEETERLRIQEEELQKQLGIGRLLEDEMHDIEVMEVEQDRVATPDIFDLLDSDDEERGEVGGSLEEETGGEKETAGGGEDETRVE